MIALFARARALWALRNFGSKIAHLFLDRRISPALKGVTALAALLIVSPLDILSDIPILGLFDDVALLSLLALLFVKLCPPDIVAEYTQKPARRPATIDLAQHPLK
ncbi:MAG: DUF1232 domain-containing protein [Candidatus Eremiobacteraeota bacterium]|nr:DUF1232 domain-containing protein [Candidatus Eremiobacteraeota bacterium]